MKHSFYGRYITCWDVYMNWIFFLSFLFLLYEHTNIHTYKDLWVTRLESWDWWSHHMRLASDGMSHTTNTNKWPEMWASELKPFFNEAVNLPLQGTQLSQFEKRLSSYKPFLTDETCRYHAIHSEVYKWFDIKFDKFGRTSSPQQTVICQAIFHKLMENKWLTENTMQQVQLVRGIVFLYSGTYVISVDCCAIIFLLCSFTVIHVKGSWPTGL